MARTETPPYLPLHPKIGYEHSDANTRHIVLIGVGYSRRGMDIRRSVVFLFRLPGTASRRDNPAASA